MQNIHFWQNIFVGFVRSVKEVSVRVLQHYLALLQLVTDEWTQDLVEVIVFGIVLMSNEYVTAMAVFNNFGSIFAILFIKLDGVVHHIQQPTY